MLLFNGESVPIALGYVASKGLWILVLNVVSKAVFTLHVNYI